MSTNDACCSTTPTGSALARRQNGQGIAPVKDRGATYRPPLDLYDMGDRYELYADLPGVTPDSIGVSVDGDILIIEADVPARYPEDATPLHAEYGVGDFRRRIRLGEDVDSDALTASYADGVLTLTLPKRAEHRPRRIEVRAG